MMTVSRVTPRGDRFERGTGALVAVRGRADVRVQAARSAARGPGGDDLMAYKHAAHM